MALDGWRCWGCGRPVAPVTKCDDCGWTVAVHSTRLTLTEMVAAVDEPTPPKRPGVLRGMWQWLRSRP